MSSLAVYFEKFQNMFLKRTPPLWKSIMYGKPVYMCKLHLELQML